MMKKLLSLFLALAASVGTLFAQSGTCGTNLTWTLSNGILTISGTGAMTNYEWVDTTPWYSYCSSITTVIIEDGVTSIGNHAFHYCRSLTSITIPNSVTSIGSWTFRACSTLTSITIPNSVTSIGEGAFKDCDGLTSVTIPNSVTSIGRVAFGYCSDLTAIIVESGNPYYDSRDNCNAIIETATNILVTGCKNTTIPNSVTSIGWGAFFDCRSLTSITIPNSVTSIGDYAFSYCFSLTSVTIPNSVTSIGEGAFLDCTSLTSVTIPSSVTSISTIAFSGCRGLTSIIVDSKNPNYCDIDGVLFNTNRTELIRYPEAKSATNYVIPNSVTSIGSSAFRDCRSLTSVTIPNSVTSIGNYAFYDCRSLTSITCEAVVSPTLGNNAFYNVDKSIPLYVPAQSIDLYKAADQWKDFTNILPIPDVEQHKFTITWQDEDGNVIKTDEVAQGTTPAFTGTTPTKPATNEYTYEFAGWLPKIKAATEDAKYTTFFERNKIETSVYTVNINGENCSLNINNQYPEGTVITLEAVADECFEFQQWSDGNKDNPRTITVTANTNLTAEFNKVRYTVTGQPSTGGKVQIRKQ